MNTSLDASRRDLSNGTDHESIAPPVGELRPKNRFFWPVNARRRPPLGRNSRTDGAIDSRLVPFESSRRDASDRLLSRWPTASVAYNTKVVCTYYNFVYTPCIHNIYYIHTHRVYLLLAARHRRLAALSLSAVRERRRARSTLAARHRHLANCYRSPPFVSAGARSRSMLAGHRHLATLSLSAVRECQRARSMLARHRHLATLSFSAVRERWRARARSMPAGQRHLATLSLSAVRERRRARALNARRPPSTLGYSIALRRSRVPASARALNARRPSTLGYSIALRRS